MEFPRAHCLSLAQHGFNFRDPYHERFVFAVCRGAALLILNVCNVCEITEIMIMQGAKLNPCCKKSKHCDIK